jgi:hypothetical protein
VKVQYVNDATPRSDGRSGKPTGITLFQTYTVVAVEGDKYVLLNDDYKLCRYSQARFLVTSTRKIEPIRKAFNSLTHPLRMEVKRLRQLVTELNG